MLRARGNAWRAGLRARRPQPHERGAGLPVRPQQTAMTAGQLGRFRVTSSARCQPNDTGKRVEEVNMTCSCLVVSLIPEKSIIHA